MTSKICVKCKRDLPINQFKSVVNGLTTKNCLYCRELSTNSQHKSTSAYFKTKQHYQNLKNNSEPCISCGDNNPEHKEFDHIDPKGKINIENKKVCCVHNCNTIESMNKEVKKCQILCRKCHCKKTMQDKLEKDKNKIYSTNKETEKVRNKLKRNKEYVHKIKIELGGCQNEECNDIFDSANLSFYEFDHINHFDKIDGVCALMHKPISTKRIQEEIDKCILLCAYCHITKTKKQRKERVEENKEESIQMENKDLTSEQIKEIRRLWLVNFKIQRKDLAKQFNCSDSHISGIVNNKWKPDKDYIPPINRPIVHLLKRKLNDEQVSDIRQIYSENKYSQNNLAKQFNCSKNLINQIVNNKTNY